MHAIFLVIAQNGDAGEFPDCHGQLVLLGLESCRSFNNFGLFNLHVNSGHVDEAVIPLDTRG